MKFTVDCEICPCVRVMEDSSQYCIFHKPRGVVIVRDDPDSCTLIDESSPVFGKVLMKYGRPDGLESAMYKEA